MNESPEALRDEVHRLNCLLAEKIDECEELRAALAQMEAGDGSHSTTGASVWPPSKWYMGYQTAAVVRDVK